LLSTFLSPLTTPLVLQLAALVTTGGYSADLSALASYSTNVFLALFVLLPSLAGMIVRSLLGETMLDRAKPYLKISNIAVLLLLSYSNAAVSLPTAFAQPDIDFLIATLVVVATLCSFAFAAGWVIARVIRANREQEPALIFGLGMNNNGTGLVLASASLADHPLVMLPIIFYNLVQHLVAAAVDHIRYRKRSNLI
jgi:BASS family bile acid:Na+ symporter